MGEEQVFSLIGSLGFPIVMASYFAFTLNKTMQNMDKTLTMLVEKIERIDLKGE